MCLSGPGRSLNGYAGAVLEALYYGDLFTVVWKWKVQLKWFLAASAIATARDSAEVDRFEVDRLVRGRRNECQRSDRNLATVSELVLKPL